eukprot:1807768-Alexandrium_andersonii.AAC.1
MPIPEPTAQTSRLCAACSSFQKPLPQQQAVLLQIHLRRATTGRCCAGAAPSLAKRLQRLPGLPAGPR